MPDRITRAIYGFQNPDGSHTPLSNFYPSQIEFAGHSFRSAEHAFQAAKCTRPTDVEKIQKASSPGQAKRIGQTVRLRGDWEDVKVSVLHQIVRAKFVQNEDCRTYLAATGSAYLEETNFWRDSFYGVCNGVGKNVLGLVLMLVRAEIIDG